MVSEAVVASDRKLKSTRLEQPRECLGSYDKKFRGSVASAESVQRLKGVTERGAWVAQSVKRPTLGFHSGHDLTVHEFQPRSGSVLTA